MSDPFFVPQSRRDFLHKSLAGAGALAGLAGLQSNNADAAPTGRKTDTVRLTWGYFGLTLIAKERGELDKLLAKDGIKVEWLGPFPNHAPTLQAVTGGSADFGFGGSTTPALAAIIAGSPSFSRSSSSTIRAQPPSSRRIAPASTRSMISSESRWR